MRGEGNHRRRAGIKSYPFFLSIRSGQWGWGEGRGRGGGYAIHARGEAVLGERADRKGGRKEEVLGETTRPLKPSFR